MQGAANLARGLLASLKKQWQATCCLYAQVQNHGSYAGDVVATRAVRGEGLQARLAISQTRIAFDQRIVLRSGYTKTPYVIGTTLWGLWVC